MGLIRFENEAEAEKAAQAAKVCVAIGQGHGDELRRLALGLPEGTKFISLNGGLTYWPYRSPQHLVEIGALSAYHCAPADAVTFPCRCVEATLKAEQDLFWTKELGNASVQKEISAT